MFAKSRSGALLRSRSEVLEAHSGRLELVGERASGERASAVAGGAGGVGTLVDLKRIAVPICDTEPVDCNPGLIDGFKTSALPLDGRSVDLKGPLTPVEAENWLHQLMFVEFLCSRRPTDLIGIVSSRRLPMPVARLDSSKPLLGIMVVVVVAPSHGCLQKYLRFRVCCIKASRTIKSKKSLA